MSKIALITGASRGIGAAIVFFLAETAYEIWANYRSNKQAADSIKKKIEEKGAACKLLQFDVANEEQVKEVLYKELDAAIPDVLINNAGFSKDTLMIWMSPDEWKTVTDVTLLGFFLVTKAVLLGMMKRKSGRIINVASTSGQTGLPGQVNYSAAKAGIIGATKSLAKEAVSKGVLVNAIAPGLIETDMPEKPSLDEIKEFRKKQEEIATNVEV